MSTECEVRFERVMKSIGGQTILDDVSFNALPGQITGIVGPNGAGKTTAFRILLGLASADEGSATIGGRGFAAHPAGTVGALLNAGAHPGRTGRDHLRIVAAALGIASMNVDAVLEEVELVAAARRRISSYSLGMRQRLALAAALLGDPPVLVLDEPANGLDPDGIIWLRKRLRAVADKGGVVVISSHVLSELEHVIDHVVVLRRNVVWSGRAESAVSESPDGTLEGLYGELLQAAV